MNVNDEKGSEGNGRDLDSLAWKLLGKTTKSSSKIPGVSAEIRMRDASQIRTAVLLHQPTVHWTDSRKVDVCLLKMLFDWRRK